MGVILLSLSALGVGCRPACALPPGRQDTATQGAIGFTLASSDGEVWTLPLPARATVIEYWAPTCVPCRRKLPELVARRADIREARAELVLVGVLAEDETTEGARNVLASWGVSDEQFLIDRHDVSARQAGVRALPTTQVFDRGGTLRWVADDESSAEDVVRAVRASDACAGR
jgi:thiol-disulfide isomerase/thioredoxin